MGFFARLTHVGSRWTPSLASARTFFPQAGCIFAPEGRIVGAFMTAWTRSSFEAIRQSRLFPDIMTTSIIAVVGNSA